MDRKYLRATGTLISVNENLPYYIVIGDKVNLFISKSYYPYAITVLINNVKTLILTYSELFEYFNIETID